MPKRLLPIFGLLAMFCCSAVALANPALTIGSGSGAMGTDVRITVTGSNLTNLTNWGFSLDYDRSKLSVVSVTSGTATVSWASVAGSVSDGKLWVGGIAGAQGTPVSGNNQRLCIITLRIAADLGLATSTSLVLLPGNPTEGLQNASLNPGSLTINVPSLALTVGNASGAVDKFVNVSVTANTPVNMTTWGFDLAFDTSKLDFVSISSTKTATSDWLSVTQSFDGKTLHVGALAGQAGTPILGSSKAILTLTFHIRVAAATASNTTANLTVSNPTGGLKGATLKSGVVTITAPATPALTIGKTTGLAGTDVTVPVTAAGVTSGTQWGFSLAFDTKKLSLKSVNKGSATGTWNSVTGSMSGGKLWVGGLAGATGAPLRFGTQAICSVSFHIMADAASTALSTVTLTAGDLTGALQGLATVTNGAVGINVVTSPTLTAGTNSGYVNSDVVVPMTASTMTTGTAFGFSLDYDHSKLSFKTVWNSSPTATWPSLSGGESGGKLWIGGLAGISGTPVVGTKVELCRAVFHVNSSVNSTTITTVTLTPGAASGFLTGAVLTHGAVVVKPTPIPSLTVGNATAATNAKVAVDVTASGLTTTTAFGFTLDYDHSKLYLDSVTSGTTTAKWVSVTGSESNGYLRIGGLAGTAAPIVGDNQIICRIYFRTRSEAGVTTGATPVTLTPALPTDGLKGATLKSGTLTITGDIPLLLKIGTGSGNVGTTMTVTATANGLTSSTAWGFDMAGDPTGRISFEGVNKTRATSRWTTVTATMMDDNMRVTAFSGSATRTISGMNQDLCSIVIRIKSAATGTTVPLTAYNTFLGLHSATLIPGQVTIKTAVTVGQVGGRVGSGVTVPVTANGLSTCTSFGFDLDYDATQLDYASIRKGQAISGSFTSPAWPTLTCAPAGTNKLRITAAAAPNALKGISGDSLALCQITFNIKPTASSGTLPLTPSNPVGGLAGAWLVPGGVIVAGDGTGRVVINVSPSSAPWTLTDVFGKSVSGAGSATLEKVASGPVTIAWQSLAHFTAPAAASKTLAPDGMAAFTEVYKANATATLLKRSQIVRYLLGLDPYSAGLDLNYDGKIDVTDLLVQ